MKAGWQRRKVAEIAQHSLGKMLDKAKNKGEPKFYPVGCVLVMLSDVNPNCKDVGFGQRREVIIAHRSWERACRQWFFIPSISRHA